MFTLAQGNNGAADLVTDKNIVMLASSVALAVCYDVFLAQPVAAVSYPLFVLASLSVIYGNSKHSLVRKPDFGWFLALPLLALALTRFLFANEVLRLLNSIVIPVLLVAHALLITENSRYEWFRFGFLKDIFDGLIVRPLKYTAKPLSLIWALARRDSESPSRSVFQKAVAGVIISLPVLIVVVMLLSSADQVFEFVLRTVLSNIEIIEVARHSLLVGLVTLLAFSFLWGLNNTAAAQVPCTEGEKKLDEIIVISGLGVLTSVYVLFSVIQFSYLFGSLADRLPAGLTYADYARKGFFELVAVALINTCLVVGSINCTAISGLRTAKILKVLNSALLLSTFVMLISAHFRMSLYEETYGYTYLRVFTHGFMATVFILLCATLYRVWTDKMNLAKWYVVIGLAAYVLVNYVNVDAIIAQKNLERYYRTGVIDIDYLAGLSYDAIPCLAALTKDSNWKIEQVARRHLAAKQAQLSVSRAWQGYNLSEQHAKRYLEENPVRTRVFDSALWKSDKYQRAVIVYDLLATQNLTGKGKNEIVALIGNPESGIPSADYYAWPLWSSSSPQGYDKVLWIRFKTSGYVDVYSIDDRSN